METKTIAWKEKEEAVAALRRGEIVLFPTETVYGIACIASRKEAYQQLCQAKGRPADKPFTLMCASLTQVAMRCEIDCAVASLMKAFMPGEVTLLLKAREDTQSWVDLGTGIIGVRVPNSKEVLDLIDAVGEPLLVSSANLSGGKPATNYEEAKAVFDGKAHLIIQGECISSIPSTIVSCVEGKIQLVRQGGVDFEDMKRVYESASFAVAVGCDHGGFEYKTAIVDHLKNRGYHVLDFGCNSKASVDYPQYGRLVGEAVAAGKANLGIVVCTSGEGISIAANKVPGIRCGIGYDDIATGKTREHNNANVIAFGQKYMSLADVLRRIDIFLSEKFSPEEKHHRRVAQIDE